MTQPEALRLAEQLEAIGLRGPVAAELRRLHAEVERLSLDGIHSCHAECQRPVCRLARERDALLEALRKIGRYTGEGSMYSTPWRNIVADLGQTARAAIAKVEGENA